MWPAASHPEATWAILQLPGLKDLGFREVLGSGVGFLGLSLGLGFRVLGF